MPNSYETTYVKKFLDANGLAHFAQKLNQYPTNDVIEAVVEGVQDALDEKLNVTEKGAASGVAPLGADSKVPLTNLPTMNGANSSQAGSAGIVPAPTSLDSEKYLKGDGTWGEPGGSSIYQFTLDNMTNASGVYSHSTAIPLARASMKAVNIECSNPDAFLDAIAVTISNGSVLVECNNVLGSSTISVTAAEQDNGEELTTTQYDLLIDKIGDITNLSTTNKSSLTVAVNELNNNKIDKPTSVAAGKFLQTDSNGHAVWGNAVLPTDVENAVTNWLDDNIPTGQTVAVDQSLTVSGAAADAKVVGDDISDLKSAVTELEQRVDSLEADVIISSASGSVASFPDGAARPVDDLTVKIEPVQDLHGYDSPWPAGGGKNKAYLEQGTLNFSSDGTEAPSTNRLRTNYIPITANVEYRASFDGDALVVKNGCIYDANKQYLGYGSFPNYTGKYITTNSNVKFVRLIYGTSDNVDITPDNYKYQFEQGSTATSWTPYSNICPITGWTGANVTRTGKNLSSVELLAPTTYWGSSYAVLVDLINSLPVGTYTLSHKATVLTLPDSGTIIHGPFYVTAIVNGSQVPVSSYRTTTDNSPSVGKVYEDSTIFTITETNKGKCNHVYSYCDSSVHTGTGRGNYQIYNIQLELGSTATAYEPYSGQTYDITFPSEAGTVYGGELTVNEDGTGKLVVDRAKMSLATVANWNSDATSSAGYIRFVYNVVSKLAGYNLLCDTLPVRLSIIPTTPTEEAICGYSNNQSIYVAINASRLSGDLSTASGRSTAFREYLADNPINIVYELSNPITYTVTATEISTMLGQNNIWADTGDTSVTYKADTKLYIDNKITQAIAAALSA